MVERAHFAGTSDLFQRSIARLRIALLMVALGAVLLGAGVFGASPTLASGGFAVLLVAALESVFGWWLSSPQRRAHAAIEASSEGLRVDSALVLPRAEIQRALLDPRSMRVRLERGFARPALEVAVRNSDEGRALLRALGLDVTQTVTTFSLPSRAFTETKWRVLLVALLAPAFVLALGGFGLVAQDVAGDAMFLLLPFFVMVALFLVLTPTELRVGADGIVTTWFGKRRFIGYDEVATIAAATWGGSRSSWCGLTLCLRSGEELRLAVESNRRAQSSVKVKLIEERVREAITSFNQGDTSADASVLRRGDRDIATWVRQLRSIGAGANAAHRTAPVPPERLWRIVEDASADPTARAGAAVALGAAIDEEGKQRLRAAAVATASPRVRIAIVAAATTDDDAPLIEALGDIEESASRVRPKSA